jgi:hypothetical protein
MVLGFLGVPDYVMELPLVENPSKGIFKEVPGAGKELLIPFITPNLHRVGALFP